MKKRIGIYVDDFESYSDLQLSIKKLWYKTFGENLTSTLILHKALEYLKNDLEHSHANKRQTIHKYIRTGIQD